MKNSANTQDYYRNLKVFSSLDELTDKTHYSPVPSDWILVITDVKGSTKAIQEGRYKDVNVVGACSIIAAQNACPEFEFPFVFGGDGATLLLPPSHIDQVLSALSFNRKMAREQFNLDLRIGRVPISKIYEDGYSISIAKYGLSAGNAIAMMSGAGVNYGEKLTKEQDSIYLQSKEDGAGSLKGLECRWSPVVSKKHGMMTLLIQVLDESEQRLSLYGQILKQIQGLVADMKPIRRENLSAKWPPKHLYAEARVRFKTRLGQYLWIGAMMPLMLLLAGTIKLLRNKEENAVATYIDGLVKNTDHIKFDETLRMVLDVSQQEGIQIENLLIDLKKRGLIIYGIHLSPEALMTCFIQTFAKHLHFVDGGDGGYAMAAVQLKQQKRELAEAGLSSASNDKKAI